MQSRVTRLLRAAALFTAALCSQRADAGLRFDFEAEATGYSYGGRMSLEGPRLRIDITSGNHPMFNANISIISRNEGTEVLVLDHARRTFFQRQVGHIAGPIATARGMGETKLLHHRVWKTKESLGNGLQAKERHSVFAEYRIGMEVGGEKFDGTVRLNAEFDIDPRFEQRAHPWGLQHAAKTGFEKLDNAIAFRIPNRLPLRQHVTISRSIAGGAAITESLTITVSNIIEEDIPDREFFAPAGYPYEEPVFKFGSLPKILLPHHTRGTRLTFVADLMNCSDPDGAL